VWPFATTTPASAATSRGVEVSVRATATYGAVLVVGAGRLKGTPLYEFSGDQSGVFRCGTTLAKGFDLGPVSTVPLTCSGPEKDFLDGNKTDDWPALTTTAPPRAGPGVRSWLLSTVSRKGIGNQVTYAGHPLYLFDPPSTPFTPQGEGYVETVSPLAPWHGYWFLVSATNGASATGTVTLERERRPNGSFDLAVREDAEVYPLNVSVYVNSRGASVCTGFCKVTWVPLLSRTSPHVGAGLDASLVGSVPLANGTRQVTYAGRPLFLFAKEKVPLVGLGLRTAGSSGNGNGLAGPAGSTFSLVPLPPSASR